MDDNILHFHPPTDFPGQHNRQWRRFEVRTRFRHWELLALRDFYAGVPARQIRRKYCDPWDVVARHRALPKNLYEAVKWELISLPVRRTTPSQYQAQGEYL